MAESLHTENIGWNFLGGGIQFLRRTNIVPPPLRGYNWHHWGGVGWVGLGWVGGPHHPFTLPWGTPRPFKYWAQFSSGPLTNQELLQLV